MTLDLQNKASGIRHGGSRDTETFPEQLRETADTSYGLSEASAVVEEGLFKCIKSCQTLRRFCPLSKDNLNHFSLK